MAKLVPGTILTQGAVLDDLPWGVGDDAPLGVVLTNECDLEWEKASFVVVAALVSARDVIHESKEVSALIGSGSLSRKGWDALDRLLTKYVHNSDICRYFLVEADCLGLPPLFVDFQKVLSVPFSETPQSVVARIPNPYREQMIVHFASYVSRIAVDRPERITLERLVDALADPIRRPS